jgi:hypothetical protein
MAHERVPPPNPRATWGRASLTFKALPPASLPFRAAAYFLSRSRFRAEHRQAIQELWQSGISGRD